MHLNDLLKLYLYLLYVDYLFRHCFLVPWEYRLNLFHVPEKLKEMHELQFFIGITPLQ